MALSEPQRGFLQLMMERKFLPADEALEAYNEIHLREASELGEGSSARGQVSSEAHLDKRIGDINKKLDLLSVSIVKQYIVHEAKQFYAFVNTVADDAAKLGTALTQSETALFNLVVQRIIDSAGDDSPEQLTPGTGTASDLTLGFHDAQNLGREIENCAKLKPSEALETINKLSAGGWLRTATARGLGTRVGLGVRSIIELPELKELNRSRAMDAGMGGNGGLARVENGTGQERQDRNDLNSTSRKRSRADEADAPAVRSTRNTGRRSTRSRVVDDDDEGEE